MMSANKRHDELSRRALLTGGLAAGFTLAFHLPLRAAVNEPVQPLDATDGKFAPNAFIRIDQTGKVTLVMPQVEMGQGVYTSIPMILAEELDADIAQVAPLHAPPNDKLYGNPTFGLQVTGNSNSIRAFWKPLRSAGASARAMLVQAAARHGRSMQRVARRRRARSRTPRAAENSPTARWRSRRAAKRRRRTFR